MDSTQFEKRVRETLRNPAGQRSLSDHLRRLAPEITALREDGVDWAWIAEVLGSVREQPPRCTDHAIRTLWSRRGLVRTASGQADGQRVVTGPQAPAGHPAGNRREPSPLSRMLARQSRSKEFGRHGVGGDHE